HARSVSGDREQGDSVPALPFSHCALGKSSRLEGEKGSTQMGTPDSPAPATDSAGKLHQRQAAAQATRVPDPKPPIRAAPHDRTERGGGRAEAPASGRPGRPGRD